MNLPVVPITDLAIKNDNLIAATQGRSFWIIDDLTPIHQMNESIKTKNFHLFKPMDSYRMGGGNGAISKTQGTNHPGGVLINYHLMDTAKTDTITISLHENNGKVIKIFSTHPNKEENEVPLINKPGFNTLNWNLKYNGAKKFDGMILWWATTEGPTAIPGKYKVKMVKNGDEIIEDFKILADPRVESSQADMEAQFNFLLKIRDKLSETHEGIIKLRKAKSQINARAIKTTPMPKIPVSFS